MTILGCILLTPALPSWTQGAGNVVPHHHTAPAWRPRTFECLEDLVGRALGGRRFSCDDTVKAEIQKWLRERDVAILCRHVKAELLAQLRISGCHCASLNIRFFC